MKCSVIALAVLTLVSCGRVDQDSTLERNRGSGKDNRRQSSSSDDFEENDGRFPRSPVLNVTPGELCQNSSTRRYREQVRYCERDVAPALKGQIFIQYDHQLGFKTLTIPREHFKIDHLIPLCMGGSNERRNLWPQHRSIYDLTDPIEPFLCEFMAAGKLKQADAVKIIKEVKQAPETTDARMDQVRRMYSR